MSQIGDFDERALIGRALSGEMVAVRERSRALALMDAGDELALDRSAMSGQPVERLALAWDSALFGVAGDFDRQPVESRA